MDMLIHLRKMNHDLWTKKDLKESYKWVKTRSLFSLANKNSILFLRFALEIDKTNMPIVTTQVTRDYFRLEGHNVPTNVRRIESIIGRDSTHFINDCSTTTTTTTETDDEYAYIVK